MCAVEYNDLVFKILNVLNLLQTRELLMRSRASRVHVSLYKLILSVRQSGPGGPRTTCKHNRLIEVQDNDVNVQCTNVTDSVKFLNTKLYMCSWPLLLLHNTVCRVLWTDEARVRCLALL